MAQPETAARSRTQRLVGGWRKRVKSPESGQIWAAPHLPPRASRVAAPQPPKWGPTGQPLISPPPNELLNALWSSSGAENPLFFTQLF